MTSAAIGIVITLVILVVCVLAGIMLIRAIWYKFKLKSRRKIQKDELERTKIQDL